MHFNPPLMTILNYKPKCQFERNEKSKNIIIFYSKQETQYNLLHNTSDETKQILSNYLSKTNASDKPGETRFLLLNKDYDSVVLSCVGKSSVEDVRVAAANGIKKFVSMKIFDVLVSVDFMAEDVAIGCVLGAYKYDILRKDKSDVTKSDVVKIAPHKKSDEYEKGACIAYHQNFARFLADTPANLMTPTLFVEYARDFLKDKGVEIVVHEREYLEKNNMNLFLSVTEGSSQPPKFLVINYKPKGEAVDVALVGKGITFDSGGISIKPSRGMGDMKADMMGAASVVAAIGLCASLKVDINITVSVPLCENLPSGTASKPGDVRIAMNGLSVEIDNTDAEGRLVLGDAMVHAQKVNPKYLIDVATLTGAICVALGQVYIGCFSNDDELANLITETGVEVDNLTWRMPLSSKYRSVMDSNVADIKNASDGRGGSCTAAIFLNEFVNEKSKWAHLDIASVMNETNSALYGKGMTGKPTQLLYKVIERLSKK